MKYFSKFLHTVKQVIRELSDEQERKDSQSHDEKVREIQETLDRANEELDKLRGDRTRHIESIETIVRQRDMYRVLLAQEPNVCFLSVLLVTITSAHIVEFSCC